MRKFRSIGVPGMLLCLACFMSNISQLPSIVASGRTQLYGMPMWIVLLVVLLIKSRGKLSSKALMLFVYSIPFFVLIALFSLFTHNNYFSSSLVYSYMISIFIFALGAMGGRYCDSVTFKYLGYSYIISSVVVSAAIFFGYFGFGYSLNTSLYAYGSKNSIAQIIVTAIIILIIQIKPEKTFLKAARIVAIVFEIILLLYLRSRASILSLFVVVLILIMSRTTNKKLKYRVLFVALVAIVYFLTHSDLFDAFVNNILLAGRSGTNLNSISSGRINILKEFPALIKGNEITGVGNTYYECFPLSSILQFGIGAGSILIYIACTPLIESVKCRNQSDFWFELLLIASAFLVDGVFEGLTPFGPGIKCYYLWLFFGLLLTSSEHSQTGDHDE